MGIPCPRTQLNAQPHHCKPDLTRGDDQMTLCIPMTRSPHRYHLHIFQEVSIALGFHSITQMTSNSHPKLGRSIF